ncbi:Glycosyltransferase involved in cell wall bisynthesis [Xylanibacter ruminicola]|uniref:Glycosyltransferase involved in cell wall bisynthesis n=1 Tax=Xylanibacter ruminicola TaxID=839 RepID=A0A1H4C4M4_XYLRU|nr:glycosyltransferase family 4 protein [Xylanibacter ruminicola]SEA55331.1 Glycosyltransferase involved in cell wall bisynthesis [Xylanibacter ruminicola]
MKKVLIISAVFPPEQVTSALMNYDMARELSNKYEVTVLRPYPTRPLGMNFNYHGMGDEPFETILIDSYTHPQSILVGRFKESVDFGCKCAKYIKEHHKEIAFIYNNPWQLFGVYIIARAANKYKIPYTVAIQDIYPECLFTNKHYPSLITTLAMALLMPIDKYYQKHAAFIRTISVEMADYLSFSRKLPGDKYLVVNNWQNDEDFEDLKPAHITDKQRFVYTGSINLHANVDLIIKAFAQANLPNSELVIYGGGNQKDVCVKMVKDMGLKNVRFDFVKRSEIPQVQADASALVLALPKGNGNLCLPSKMTSYMLSGKPVIASVDQMSATTRYINEADCGLSVVPDDIDALAEGFRKFAILPSEKRISMGSNSRIFAETHLTRAINLKMVCDAIKNCIKQ